jgi:hypothetical protein
MTNWNYILHIHSHYSGSPSPNTLKNSDSFEELEVGRDTVTPSSPLYPLLPHPLCGLITASTPKQ